MARMTAWRAWIGTPRGVAMSSLVAAAAAVTAATFTARLVTSHRFWYGSAGSPIEQEAQVSARKYRDAWLGARRIRVRDSLFALARPGVQVLVDGTVAPRLRVGLERRLRLAWGAFGIGTTRVPVVLAWLDASGTAPFRLSSFAAFPAAAGQPCLVVITGRDIMWFQTVMVNSIARDARLMRDFMFGCALYARHGVPGAAVSAELQRIGWAPTALRFDQSGYVFNRLESTLETAEQSPPWALPFIGCSAGQATACEKAANRRVTRVREKPPFMRSPDGRLGSDVSGRSLLALLQVSMPAGAFARLWRDDHDFGAALADITGREKGDWFRQVLLREMRPKVATFSPVAPLVWRAVVFTVIAALTAVLLQSRRTVTS